MAMLMDDSVGNFDFYCQTTTSTTTTTSSSSSEGRSNWGDWSPLVDWDALRGHGPNEDFHGLIDSLIDHGAGNFHSEGYMSNSLNSPDTTIDVDVHDHVERDDDPKGLRLVHLLMAAAEALAGANKSRDLARVILVRLKELAASPADGSNMERLAAYFTDALYSLLEGTAGPHGKRVVLHTGGFYNRDRDPDVLAAFQLLQDMSPYVKFGHFTANQAILEAVANDRRVHVIDYDIMEGIQWPSLMQALVSRKDNPPPTHFRITAIAHGGGGRRSIGTVQETGRRLVSFAASIGLPFSFHQCRLDSDDGFRPSSVKLVKGEALVVNCMLHLPHFNYRSSKSVRSFLSGAKTLNPKTMTMVEEEMGAAGDGGGFVGRFVDSLHHYSALYDSLEAGLLPVRGQSAASRALVERVFMGPRIVATVARMYRSGCEEEEELSGSGCWLMGMGYKPVGVSFSNHCQARLLLGLFNDGYCVEESANNRLTLGWKSRRLLSASVWKS